MAQSQHQVKVQATNPLDKQSDLLERGEEIENLTNLLTNINTPLVMAINSPWGSGKTFFINKWSKHLDDKGIENINFNAWKTDFSTDPLLTFISELDIKLGNYILKSTK